MLEIKNLHAYYGSVEALHDVSMNIEKGRICCIIGSNGAGKTTLVNSISGITSMTGGIFFEGKDITRVKAHKRAALGIAHVPEGRQIFPGLTVEQNLEVSTISWRSFIGKGSCKNELEMVYEIFPRLRERRTQLGWSLSGGEQQMLAIGRALMIHPKILLMDEPSMGLAPLVVEELFEKISEINKTMNLSVLLNEQNAMIALELSDYAYVLEQGKVILEGKASDVEHDPRVVEAYLGKLANL